MNESYRAAGVDVEKGYEAVNLIKAHTGRTTVPGVLTGIGGFGGLFELGKGYENPVLVSGTDGVGTKLKLAFMMDKHDTIGQDCVAMCANDVACSGAKPLFFLDYLAMGQNVPTKVADIVKGVADGCVRAGCALIGGETAEMPGFYPVDEYDLAGFCVGVIDKSKILSPENVCEGDVLIGLKSSGVHSNGYSLVRKVFSLNTNYAHKKLNEHFNELGRTLGEELLEPTKIYVKDALVLAEGFGAHAIAHVTGGGFYENVPRMMPKGLTAKITKASIPVLPIFEIIASYAKLPEEDMFATFNMGIGLVASMPKNKADAAVAAFGNDAVILGEVVCGDEGIILG